MRRAALHFLRDYDAFDDRSLADDRKEMKHNPEIIFASNEPGVSFDLLWITRTELIWYEGIF